MTGPTVDSTAVIVLGPYRSGTSVTAQVLSALGVDFGPKRHLIPARQENPGGFLERKDINAANEALIHSVGKTLADPGEPRELAAHCDPTAFSTADMSWCRTSPIWGIKDPRLCGTLLAWLERGPLDRSAVRIIHIRRKLDGAVRSSMTFDAIRNFCDGTEDGVRAMLDLYARLAQWHVDTLGLPALSIDYEQLIREPEATVRQIAQFLNIKDERRIRRATKVIGKGKGKFALQLERYLVRAPRRLFYLLTGRNRDGSPKQASKGQAAGGAEQNQKRVQS
jgi:hypothetical protein